MKFISLNIFLSSFFNRFFIDISYFPTLLVLDYNKDMRKLDARYRYLDIIKRSREYYPKFIEKLKLLSSDFEYYCRRNINIINKAGKKTNFVFNKAQQIVYQKIKEQMEQRGYVRLIIIKSRQQGISTLCRAYLLWTLSFRARRKALAVA